MRESDFHGLARRADVVNVLTPRFQEQSAAGTPAVASASETPYPFQLQSRVDKGNRQTWKDHVW